MNRHVVLLLAAFACCFHAKSAVIALPKKPTAVETTAAAELQEHIRLATGKELHIVTEGTSRDKAFFLGQTDFARQAGIAKPETPNAFTTRSIDGNLVIIGADGNGPENSIDTPAGTLFGVYDYLREALGIRWLYPGPDGITAPKRDDIPMGEACNRQWTPRLMDRTCSSASKDPAMFRFFRRTMFLSRISKGRGGHNVNFFRKYGKDHPEIYAVSASGKRGTSLCLNNPTVWELLVKDAIEKDPENPCISAHESDTTNRCCCEKCRSWDGPDTRGPTGRYARFANCGERYAHFYRALLDEGRKTFPNIRLSGYAYQSYFYAPRTVRLDPAIEIGLVPDIPFPRTQLHKDFLNTEYDAWKATGATLYLRPNYFLGGYCLPALCFREYAEEFKRLYALGMTGLTVDGPGNMFAVRSQDYYIMARLAIDPDADVDKLLDEYLAGFGKAAPFIRQYTERLLAYQTEHCEKINALHAATSGQWYFHGFISAGYAHKLFPKDDLLAFRPLLMKAEAAADTPDAKRHTAFFLAGLDHAVASVKCAEIFARDDASADLLESSWRNLDQLRQSLPPFAVNAAYLQSIEKRSWNIMRAPLLAGTLQAIPQMQKVRIDPQDIGEKQGWHKPGFKDDDWQMVSTWRSLESSGIRNFKNAFYRIPVRIPEQDGTRCILRFGAIDKNCKVWVNGNLAGTLRYDPDKNPDSWKEPFVLDITPFVESEKDALICVKLENDGGHSGIWKPSFLQCVRPVIGEQIPLNLRRGTQNAARLTAMPENPKRNAFLVLKTDIPENLAVPGKIIRITGKIRIEKAGSAGRVDVSLRQFKGKNILVPFADNLYNFACDWEDFSLETAIMPDTTTATLNLIARNLQEKAFVEVKDIAVQEVEPTDNAKR